MTSFARRLVLATLWLSALAACEQPPPPQAPPPYVPNEADASLAFAAAKTQGTIDALFSVYRKFPKQPSGREALVLASQRVNDDVDEKLAKCDEDGAKESAGRLGPLTLVAPEADKAYDETQKKIVNEHERCQIGRMEADVEKFVSEWQWPKVFERILSEKEVSGAKLKDKRAVTIDRWRTFVDSTARSILAKKSLEGVSDKRDRLLASVAKSNLPPELEAEADRWAPILQLLVLVYGDAKEGQLVDPPKRYRVMVETKVRSIETPTMEGSMTLGVGVIFHVIARGKLDGVTVLVIGKSDKDPMKQLATAKLVVPEAATKVW